MLKINKKGGTWIFEHETWLIRMIHEITYRMCNLWDKYVQWILPTQSHTQSKGEKDDSIFKFQAAAAAGN